MNASYCRIKSHFSAPKRLVTRQAITAVVSSSSFRAPPLPTHTPSNVNTPTKNVPPKMYCQMSKCHIKTSCHEACQILLVFMTSLLLIPLLRHPPHSSTILLELLTSLLSRLLDLKCERLVRSHTNLMAAERMLHSADSLHPKIRKPQRRATASHGVLCFRN